MWGQGEIHLQVALDRLRRKYNLPMATHLPQVPYKETIRKPIASIHGRYKHQSGGHGSINTRSNTTYKVQISENFLVLRMAIINVESRPNSHM